MLKKAPTHSNQQLAALCEHLCAKLLSDYKEFDPEICSCTTTRYLLGPHSKALGILSLGTRNALRSVESSIQVKFSRFL